MDTVDLGADFRLDGYAARPRASLAAASRGARGRTLQGDHEHPARVRRLRHRQGARPDPRGRHRRQADAEAGLDHLHRPRAIRAQLSLLPRPDSDRRRQGDRLGGPARGRLRRRLRVRGLPRRHSARGRDPVLPHLPGMREGRVALDRGAVPRPGRARARPPGAGRQAAAGGAEGAGAHLQGRPARHRGAVDARDARRRAGRRRLPQGHEYRQPAGPPGRRLAGAGQRPWRCTRWP